MIQGIAYSLALLDWDVFATLTFSNPLPKNQTRWAWAFAHLHRAAHLLNRPYSEVRIALRYELGEKTERPHFHYLLGRLFSSNLVTVAGQLRHDWLRATGGDAVIRPYEPGTDAPDYLDKCLGANLYEVGKFARAGELSLSRSVLKALRNVREPAIHNGDCRGDCRGKAGRSSEELVQDKRGGGDLPEVEVMYSSSLTDCGGKDVSSHPVRWVKTSGGVYQHLS